MKFTCKMKWICKIFKENKNDLETYVKKHLIIFLIICFLFFIPTIIWCFTKTENDNYILVTKDWYVIVFPLITIILTTVKSSDDLKDRAELEREKLEEERKLYRPTFAIEENGSKREKLVVYTNSKDIMIKNIKIYNLSTNKFLENKPLKKWGEVIISLNDKDDILILCESGIGEVILFSRIYRDTFVHMYLDSDKLSDIEKGEKWKIYNNTTNNEITNNGDFIRRVVLTKTRDFRGSLTSNRLRVLDSSTLKDTIKNIIDYLICKYNKNHIDIKDIKQLLEKLHEELCYDGKNLYNNIENTEYYGIIEILKKLHEELFYDDKNLCKEEKNHEIFISNNEKNLKSVSNEFYELARNDYRVKDFDTYFKFLLDNFIETSNFVNYGLTPLKLSIDYCTSYNNDEKDSLDSLKLFFLDNIYIYIHKSRSRA